MESQTMRTGCFVRPPRLVWSWPMLIFCRIYSHRFCHHVPAHFPSLFNDFIFLRYITTSIASTTHRWDKWKLLSPPCWWLRFFSYHSFTPEVRIAIPKHANTSCRLFLARTRATLLRPLNLTTRPGKNWFRLRWCSRSLLGNRLNHNCLLGLGWTSTDRLSMEQRSKCRPSKILVTFSTCGLRVGQRNKWWEIHSWASVTSILWVFSFP